MRAFCRDVPDARKRPTERHLTGPVRTAPQREVRNARKRRLRYVVKTRLAGKRTLPTWRFCTTLTWPRWPKAMHRGGPGEGKTEGRRE